MTRPPADVTDPSMTVEADTRPATSSASSKSGTRSKSWPVFRSDRHTVAGSATRTPTVPSSVAAIRSAMPSPSDPVSLPIALKGKTTRLARSSRACAKGVVRNTSAMTNTETSAAPTVNTCLSGTSLPSPVTFWSDVRIRRLLRLPTSARAKSAAVSNRSAGVGSRARRSTASNSGVILVRMRASDRISPAICLAKIALGVGPV